MKIVKATRSSIPSIRRISREYDFEMNRDWKEAVSSKNSEMFLLLNRKTIIGFTGLAYRDWNNTLQVLDIFILPRYRHRKLGSKLIAFLVNKAKKTKYRCIIAETPSSGGVETFYKKAGFRKCGYNDRYYSNSGKDVAIWMSYDLK